MNRKFWSRALLLLLIAAVTVSCCACLHQKQEGTDAETERKQVLPTVPPYTEPPVTTAAPEDPIAQAYRKDPSAFVKFSRSIEPRQVCVSLEDIMAYESQYPGCSSTWYRTQLEGEALSIYNSYLYAMERCFTDFELYVEDNDKDFAPVRYAISLDSPFIAQNISYYEDIHDWPSTYWGEPLWISINSFAPERWAMKQEALMECQKIVAGIPDDCTTQLEKMEYLYRYVCDHVEYVDYGRMVDEDYLYDAVIKGETVCDGYSNMLLLLFRLIGVECCEVMGSDYEDFSQLSPEEKEDAAGHTWVVAKVDGEFYNFDPTYEDTKDASWNCDTVFFGFSDELVEIQYMDLDEYRPRCTDTSMDFDYADLEVSSFTKSADVKKIATLTQERAEQGEDTSLIAIREPMTQEKYEKLLEKYWRYVEDVEWVDVSKVQLGNCTLLWLTVNAEEEPTHDTTGNDGTGA